MIMTMRKWIMAGAAFLVLVVVGIVVTLARYGSNTNFINVYYFNPMALRLEAEARSLPEGEFQIQEIIEFLH